MNDTRTTLHGGYQRLPEWCAFLPLGNLAFAITSPRPIDLSQKQLSPLMCEHQCQYRVIAAEKYRLQDKHKKGSHCR